MNFSFVVCAGSMKNSSFEFFYHWISLAQSIKIPNWEILWIGPRPQDHLLKPILDYDSVRFIDFDEQPTGKAWITKKKNIGAQEAQYENIVFLHDYIRLDEGWYSGWEQFGEDFEVATNCIFINESLSQHEDLTYRHSDWVINPYDLWKLYPELHWRFWELGLPYKLQGLSKIQYLSGNYFVAKKEFMLRFPLDETKFWGDAEDIEWSERVRQHTTFKLNKQSAVWVNKPGKWKPGLLPQHYLDELIKVHNLEPVIDNTWSPYGD
jgi:hypothetical protein